MLRNAARIGFVAALCLAACSSFSGSEDSVPPLAEAGPDVAIVDDAPAADVIAVDVDTADAAEEDANRPDTSVTCNGAADCERVVFATSAVFDGAAVGGLTGADKRCNDAAQSPFAHARVKGRLFNAWISTNGSAAKDRLAHGTLPYVLPNGNPVASNWTAFVQSPHTQAINTFEDGNGNITGSTGVWTGTGGDGAPTGPNCQGWAASANAESGTAGTIGDPAGWSYTTTTSCNTMLRLYCIEK